MVTAPRTSMAGSGGTTGKRAGEVDAEARERVDEPLARGEAAGAARPEIADMTEH